MTIKAFICWRPRSATLFTARVNDLNLDVWQEGSAYFWTVFNGKKFVAGGNRSNGKFGRSLDDACERAIEAAETVEL